MSKDEDSVKEMERESFQFFGTKGKVKWVDFEKSIARHFRMKFGSIGEKLWMNELPIIDGDNAIDAHPGRYYGVLRSTRVVPVIFRRQNSNVAGVKYKCCNPYSYTVL